MNQVTADLNAKGLELLQAEKVKEFNQLREENPDWVPDLRGVTFGKSLCDVNFSKADLRGANLNMVDSNNDFRGADLRGADISPYLMRAFILGHKNVEDVKW